MVTVSFVSSILLLFLVEAKNALFVEQDRQRALIVKTFRFLPFTRNGDLLHREKKVIVYTCI